MATKKNTKPAAAKKTARTAGSRVRRDADEDADDTSVEATEAQGPQECLPCRGTGAVISNLGGEPSTIPCPWCDGGGVRLPAMDAQARWRDEAQELDSAAGQESDAADEADSDEAA